jgi:hypothetical protein
VIRRLLVRWAPGYRWAILYPALTACGAAQHAPEPPCDTATYAAKLAECTIRVRNCEPFPAPCPAEDECNAWADARQVRCVE